MSEGSLGENGPQSPAALMGAMCQWSAGTTLTSVLSAVWGPGVCRAGSLAGSAVLPLQRVRPRGRKSAVCVPCPRRKSGGHWGGGQRRRRESGVLGLHPWGLFVGL